MVVRVKAGLQESLMPQRVQQRIHELNNREDVIVTSRYLDSKTIPGLRLARHNSLQLPSTLGLSLLATVQVSGVGVRGACRSGGAPCC